ncbi:hypothetical protein [Microbispora rosea]|uniref:hypothetical protein n=1 Tax=Microbispora rosea TaxID=58117 RepID=UPI003D8FEAC9
MERVAAWPPVALTVTFAATIAFLARGHPYAPVLALTSVAGEERNDHRQVAVHRGHA